jgi:AraC-like DNA-binding protein
MSMEPAPAGTYRELPPPADLSDVIACGWTKTVRGDDLVPIIPDGCSDVLAVDDGEPFAVGPDAATRWVRLGDGVVITGIRLRPGAARAIFGCSADVLLGESADLTQIASVERRADPMATLEHWVRERKERSRHPDRPVLAACRALARTPRVTMDELADRMGWNARMLHREFVATCGYGPKFLQRILRVQAVLRARDRPLSALAVGLGFSDQAHLTREFKSITGLTPTELLSQSDPELGRWLDDFAA